MADKGHLTYHEPKLVRLRDVRSCAFRRRSGQDMCAVDRSFAHCRFFVDAALYDMNGDLIPLSERQGGLVGDHVLSISPMRLPDEAVKKERRRVSGRSIFLGHFMNHYGHFITETLSRCWSLPGGEPYDNYAFYPFIFGEGITAIQKFHEFFLQRVGIPRDKIIFLDEEVVFDDVSIPEQLWVINRSANAALAPFYARFGGRLRGSRKLFLSRIQSTFSRVTNVAAFEEIFHAAGFEILYPETLDIEQQMEAYNDGATIAGFPGSAMHNCIFAPKGCELIEIGDSRSPNEFMQMQHVANALASVNAHRIPFDESSLSRASLLLADLQNRTHQGP